MDSHEKSLNQYADSIKESMISQQLNIDSLNSEIEFRTKMVEMATVQLNHTSDRLVVALQRLDEEVEA